MRQRTEHRDARRRWVRLALNFIRFSDHRGYVLTTAPRNPPESV